ncbi:hypothetical protein Ciccas_014167, partial [Cichlidogyrus casuarinus]
MAFIYWLAITFSVFNHDPFAQITVLIYFCMASVALLLVVDRAKEFQSSYPQSFTL